MPRRYKKKKTYRRKRSSRITKKTGSGLTKSFPMAKKFVFKTRYVDLNNVLDAGAGGIAVSHVYNITSLFDPNFTGLGHQPIGFDQIMPMYDHYTVIGARARIVFTNSDPDNAQLVCLQMKDATTVSTNVSEIIENGMSRYTVLSPKGGSKDTQTLTMNFSSKKFFSRNPLASDKNQGTITSSPAEGAFLHVIVDPQTTSNAERVTYTIQIEFVAVLTEPKQLTQS